jgi:hypothetical protein
MTAASLYGHGLLLRDKSQPSLNALSDSMITMDYLEK